MTNIPPVVNDMNELLVSLSQTSKPTPYDIAVLLYKIGHTKYSCKCMKPTIWINKLDTSITVEAVNQDIVNDITITIKNMLLEYNNSLPIKSKEYKTIKKITDKIVTSKYVTDVIKEARELFYNN